jgi:hypothetical protein
MSTLHVLCWHGCMSCRWIYIQLAVAMYIVWVTPVRVVSWLAARSCCADTHRPCTAGFQHNSSHTKLRTMLSYSQQQQCG